MESGTRQTVAELVAARWGDHRPGLWCEDRTLTHHEVAAGAAARAATRRGPELARDILHTECPVLIIARTHLPLLTDLELPGVRLLLTDPEEYEDLLAPYADAEPDPSHATPSDRLLLYFTSGSTGAPKAAICTQGRLAAAGRTLAGTFAVRPDELGPGGSAVVRRPACRQRAGRHVPARPIGKLLTVRSTRLQSADRHVVYLTVG